MPTKCPVHQDLLENERAAWDSYKVLIEQKRPQEEIDQRLLLANKISADLRAHLETCSICKSTETAD